MSGKTLAAGIAANPDDQEPVASAIPLSYFSNDAKGASFAIIGVTGGLEQGWGLPRVPQLCCETLGGGGPFGSR